MQSSIPHFPEAILMLKPASEFTSITHMDTVRNLYGFWRETILADLVGLRPNKWSSDADVWVERGVAARQEVYLTAATRLSRSHDVSFTVPSKPNNADRYTLLAQDSNGRPWLLRQGRLNRPDGGPILEAQFKAAADSLPLESAGIYVPGGEARIWYRVTALDVSSEEIRFHTGLFGKACGAIRDRIPAMDAGLVEAPSDNYATGGKGPVEVPGTYDFPSTPGGTATKTQARVWVDFVDLFRDSAGFKVGKLPRLAGYEIDVFVTTPGSRKIHVEIKSSASPHDIYAGTGQIALYRHVFDLDGCEKVLLVPSPGPSDYLRDAVSKEGIILATYTIGEDTTPVGFEPAFLSFLGLS